MKGTGRSGARSSRAQGIATLSIDQCPANSRYYDGDVRVPIAIAACRNGKRSHPRMGRPKADQKRLLN
jgi:hypothetical protein